MTEYYFKHWLLRELGGGVWHTSIEPGLGGSVGAPDLVILTPKTKALVPVELKLAEIIPAKALPYGKVSGRHSQLGEPDKNWRNHLDDFLLRPYRMRATQVAWHDHLYRCGGRSRFAFRGQHVTDRSAMNVWVLDTCNHDTLKNWQDGLPFSALTRVATGGILDHEAWWRGLEGDKA